MATIQQELKPPPADDEIDEYDEEPRRRAWGAIASVVLALALVFVGYQWNQAASRADALATQANSLRAEAETQRLRAEDAQRQLETVQKRVVALAAEKDTLAERIAALEKAGQERAAAAKAERSRTREARAAAPKPRVTPVSARTAKRTP